MFHAMMSIITWIRAKSDRSHGDRKSGLINTFQLSWKVLKTQKKISFYDVDFLLSLNNIHIFIKIVIFNSNCNFFIHRTILSTEMLIKTNVRIQTLFQKAFILQHIFLWNKLKGNNRSVTYGFFSKLANHNKNNISLCIII